MSRKPSTAPSPAEVDQMIHRVSELLKATRPQLKAKKVDWHRVSQLLTMVREEIGEIAHSILDWEIEQLAVARRGDAA